MAGYEVVVIGGSGVDTIVRVDELTLPPGDVVAVPPIRDYAAHSGNGVALGYHALGLKTKFLDYLGDDLQGDLIRARYTAAGLDFSTLPAPNGTPRSVNLVDREGRRFSFYDGRHPAELRIPASFYAPFVADAQHVHVSGNHFNRDILGDLEAAAATVSTDVHAWDGVDPRAYPFAFRSDFVFMSAAVAGERTPEVLRLILDKGRARVVVATDGEHGCYAATRQDPLIRRFPAAVPERPVVDSNGAGDGFSTAFMYAWMNGADLAESVLHGAVSGAFACGAPGTHEELITGEQLRDGVERARAAYVAATASGADAA